jgi:hypothetical protein
MRRPLPTGGTCAKRYKIYWKLKDKSVERVLEIKKVHEILIIKIVRKRENLEGLGVVRSKTLKHMLQKYFGLY